jgi:putative oxidoreductase
VSSIRDLAGRAGLAYVVKAKIRGASMPSNIVLLAARILMSIIFLLSGFEKLADISGTAAYFANYHLPATTPLAILVGMIELLGGLAVLVGFGTRIAAWVLAVFCVATALVAHTDWSDMNQMINFLKNLAICGGFIALATAGAGALSVDERRA